jgi:hypothetical protein
MQLASYKNEDAARMAADSLRARFAAQLSGFDVSVTRADLGDKGVFYRVMSSPTDEGHARSICSALKTRNAACITMKL